QLDILVEFYIDRPDLEPVAPLLNRDLGFVSRPGELIDTGDNCLRFCGAGHAMVMVDVDGKSYPCHRFAPWVTRRPAPMVPVNLQTKWRPHECAECTLVALCPTCAGFNWEINGNTGMRTTFHCEAFKLELMASAKLLALKLGQMPIPDLNDLRGEEAFVLKHRLDSILQLDDIGV
ncbi:MAG: hypothetical protein GY765_10345, partial [bacterium]|nr:hypothetical protein [bacterium]